MFIGLGLGINSGRSSGSLASAFYNRWADSNGGAVFSFEDDSVYIVDPVTPANNYNGGANAYSVAKGLFSGSRKSCLLKDGTYPLTAAGALPYEWSAAGAALGLFAEPSGTQNVCSKTQDYASASWTKQGVTFTSALAGAPDGSSTLSRGILVGVAASQYVHQTYTSTAASWVVSKFIRPTGSYNKCAFRENNALGAYVAFALTGSGSVIGSGGGGSPSGGIIAYPGGFYRIWMTYTGTAATHRIATYMMDSAYSGGAPTSYTWTANGVDGFDMWGEQWELGTYPSSYTPNNGTTPVTRNADVISGLLSGVMGIGSAYTVYCEYAPVRASVETRAMRINDGSSNNVIAIGNNSSATGALWVTSGGAAQTSPLTLDTITSQVFAKMAANIQASNMILSVNGDATTQASGSVPSTSALDIAPVGSVYIKKLAIFNGARTAGGLQSLTSPLA